MEADALLNLAIEIADALDAGWLRADAARPHGTFEGLRILRYVLGQELEGHEASQLGVLSLVNHTHPAAAQLLDDAIVRDDLPDHRVKS